MAKVGDAPLQPVGPFRISLVNRPQPPAVGDNRLAVTVQDTSGAPVRGAEVSVLVVMQAMGTMPRMESRGEVKEIRPGVYEAKYGLSMAGEWDVDVQVRDAKGARADAAYRLSTSLKEITLQGGPVPGAVRIDPARRQEIGIRTAPVETRDLSTTVRAAGHVAYDETRRAEVSLKFGGWVRTLRVDYTGRPVRAGEELFTVYSPELFSAQQEYLTALASSPASPDLVQASRQRLLLWDITPEQIDAIGRAGKPMEAVPVVAPVSGIVIEKNVVRGSSFMPGQMLYKIAPIHPVWVMASIYPFELSLLRTGMEAIILTPFLPEKSRTGRVSWVSPYLAADTRTAEVRIEVPNARGDLRPDMYVDVQFEVRLGKKVAVPENAVLYVGDRRVVFVDLGDGRLAPRDITPGQRAGDYFEVLSGLKAGEIVVTSGNFLVAAESRLKAAEGKW